MRHISFKAYFFVFILFLFFEAHGDLTGKVDNVRIKNQQVLVSGWACDEGDPKSIEVRAHLQDSRLDKGGNYYGFPLGTVSANLESSDQVKNDQCGSGGAHNFLFTLPLYSLLASGHQSVEVYAVSASRVAKKLPAPTAPNTNRLPAFDDYRCQGAASDACVYPSKARQNTRAVLRDTGDESVGDDVETTIAAQSTDELTSNGVSLGINKFGGGYITKLDIPGLGNILGEQSAKYGRGGQSSIRDALHSHVYNPTQAGFTDNAGTQIRVSRRGEKLILHPRYLVGFRGDGNFDFTQRNNLARDNYDTSGDNDSRSEAKVNQAREVTTEFDFFGTYETCSDRGAVACFRHYYEYRFVRGDLESHFMKQFTHRRGRLREGGSVLNRSLLDQPITDIYSAGEVLSSSTDLYTVISKWAIRFDNSLWDPQYRFFVQKVGSGLRLRRSDRSDNIQRQKLNNNHVNGFIVATSTDPNNPLAMGVFKFRSSEENDKHIMVKKFSQSTPLDSENRRLGSSADELYIQDLPERLGKGSRVDDMSMIGFAENIRGMVNPDHLNLDRSLDLSQRKYETLRAEIYIFVGSPNEILEAVSRKLSGHP